MKQAIFAALLLVAVRAQAIPDFRAIGGIDTLLSTGPGASELTNAELGIYLRADLKNVRRMLDFKLDFVGREAFGTTATFALPDALGTEQAVVHNATFNNLYELYMKARGLGNRVDITVGRFRTPGGFWLIADGAMIQIDYTSWLRHSVYGGLRSFTTGRRGTWMADQPVALPLVGTSLLARHRIVTAGLTFTWARDAIDLHTGRLPDLPVFAPDQGKNTLERHIEDEFFLDGYAQITPHEKVWLTAGASLGTRYDVQFNALNPYGATTLGIATLGAASAWALAEVRPIKPLRLTYSFNFERVRLFQSELLAVKPDNTPIQAADGSFQDHVLRGVWLAWRALRGELSYRLRYRANTDIQHRLSLGLRGDDLFRGFGAFISIGVDVNQTASQFNRIIYSGGLSYVRSWLDLRTGVLFTDGIGSGLVWSSFSPAGGSAPNVLFPFVLETNRVWYFRGFATFWKVYAGVDLEANLDQAQLRVLLQIGASI